MIRLSRRELLQAGVTAGVGAATARWPLFALGGQSPSSLPLITKKIPSSGEALPVVGVGTNRFGVSTPEEAAPLRDVLRRLPELGGKLVDTASGYGRSEEVIGECLKTIGNRASLFLATKTAMVTDVARGRLMLDESFKRLQVEMVDLVQVHNLSMPEQMLPILREWKQAKRIRYIGVTTTFDKQYQELEALMRKETLDFIEVDYSISNRNVAERILPLAAERGMAVLIAVPFDGPRGSNLIAKTAGRPLPDFAKDIDCQSWAQFLLKYVISHPAVTCAIPGTTKVAHAIDNNGAARGTLPDAGMRARMEQSFDAL